jgi:hypothetical protein
VFVALLVGDLLAAASQWDVIGPSVGTDFDVLMDATRRWLNGGGYYADFQLAGPYAPFGPPSILYPPPSLLLFLPFLVLPSILWWLVPIAIVVGVVAWHRPQPVAWPVLALCLWFPTTTEVIYAGNPAMWVVAAIALATVIRWPGVLVLIKPSLLPFALIGCWHRSWWKGLAVLAVICVPFGALWLDYATVASNVRDPNGILYSLNQVPTMLIPVVAWLGGRYPPRFLAHIRPEAIAEPDV